MRLWGRSQLQSNMHLRGHALTLPSQHYHIYLQPQFHHQPVIISQQTNCGWTVTQIQILAKQTNEYITHNCVLQLTGLPPAAAPTHWDGLCWVHHVLKRDTSDHSHTRRQILQSQIPGGLGSSLRTILLLASLKWASSQRLPLTNICSMFDSQTTTWTKEIKVWISCLIHTHIMWSWNYYWQ